MALIKDFSIQLYSLRDETAKNFADVLCKVGALGYSGVEFAGYGDIPAGEMRSLLDANGLRSVGSHVSLDRLCDNLDEELEYNRALGSDYIVLPGAQMHTQADVRALTEKLLPVAERIKTAGFGFAYHNHAHEFAMDGDRYLMDVLLDAIPAGAMAWEMDVYWVAHAGIDYMEFLKRYPGRVRLLHLKQMADWKTKTCVDLDEGVLDFSAIIKQALQSGTEHFILEQESFAVSPYQSVEKGLRHIMSL